MPKYRPAGRFPLPERWQRGCPTCGGLPRTIPGRRRYHQFVQIALAGEMIYEHVLVMERFLGQRLPPDSKVRHINGIGNDNRIENLFLELPDEPTLYQRLVYAVERCDHCKGEYLAPPWKVGRHRRNGKPTKYCSHACFRALRSPRRGRKDTTPAAGPRDPDRWRSWNPRIAWAARMIPSPDPGPGKPCRIPTIAVTDPPDDLPAWNTYR